MVMRYSDGIYLTLIRKNGQPNFEGVDATALHNLPIISISVERRFSQLSPDFQQKVEVV
jgi:hypothetical protein